MKIHALLTLSDWFNFFGLSGSQGITRLCDVMSENGLTNLYYRTHDGGLANYPSQHCTPFVGRDLTAETGKFMSYPKAYHRYIEELDYREWNPIPVLLEAAPKAEIQPGLWYTIMEDDHGGPLKSEFFLAHPEFHCVDRNGQRIDGCLEFWFQEVRDYKMAIVDELIATGANRFLFDLVRRNGKPSSDADGFFRYGFNPEIVEGFRDETGLDAQSLEVGSPDWQRWLEFVSTPTTEFFIEACQKIQAHGGVAEFLTWPVDLKTWMGIDLERILKTIPVEAVHVASQKYSYSPADLDRQLNALEPQVKGTDTAIIPSVSAYGGMVASGLDAFFAAAQERGVESIVIHESDAIIRNRMGTRLRALKFGAPHFQRALRSRPADTINWDTVRKYSGFLRGYNESTLETDQLTEIQVTHTSNDLCIRVTCHERDVSKLLPVPKLPDDNYNVRQLGARIFWNPKESVHLFLSAPGDYNDYFHFLLDPSNTANEERRLNECWKGAWEHDAEIGDSHWTATFRLPFTTLGLQPVHGMKLAFHAVRAQSNPVQISMWNLAGTNILNPDEFGFLYLD